MTKEEKNKDTKQKILEVANELFAKNGFGGTSVRDIANSAEVNLSAINYHFKNKENLYWKVFDYNHDWMENSINEIGKKDLTTAEFAVEIFRFFMQNGAGVMNTFKIFLSDNVALPEEDLAIDKDDEIGPPGQHPFMKKIQNDLGGKVSPMGQKWAMKMIFSQIVHNSVVLNTTLMKKKCDLHDEFSPEITEKAIYHSTLAHIEYLKNNPDIWT